MYSLVSPTRRHALALLGMFALLIGFAVPELKAARGPKASSINLVPTITGITMDNGQLVASGTATATIKGKTTTVPFSNVPVGIGLAADQTGAGACPILDLHLGPITLDLLGLVVNTSPICLQVSGDNGEVLGDLLCSVAGLLNGGLSLEEILSGQGLVVGGITILPGLTTDQISDLLSAVQGLFNGALGHLLDSILGAIAIIDSHGTCAILHLELGPLTLDLLGLEVNLDNCAGGPVVVDITGETGRGNLLGNLLCELLDGGVLGLGTTLQNLLNQILGLLS